jgi:hypothetical protein
MMVRVNSFSHDFRVCRKAKSCCAPEQQLLSDPEAGWE